MNLSEERHRKRVVSLNIDHISYEEAVTKIIELSKSKRSAYVCFTNVHMVIEAYKDEKFAEQVNNATLVLTDGMPVAKSVKFFYGQKQDRIAGMDVLPDLVKRAPMNDLRILFFGSTVEILNRIKKRVEDNYPGTKIVGLVSPPFDQPLNNDLYINKINNSGANLVFVSLGCPKQEKWMADHSHQINATLLGVGAAFSVYAGLSKRAPLFMQNMGLEWLYRLFQEPNRLFKRYLKTNTLFVYLAIKIKIKNILNR